MGGGKKNSGHFYSAVFIKARGNRNSVMGERNSCSVRIRFSRI